jgi:hypothetical protein
MSRSKMAWILLLATTSACSCDEEVPGLPAGSACANATDCSAGLVCAAATDQCTADVSCTAAAECGDGAHCREGKCTPNVAGGPCETARDCIDSERCRMGTCAAPAGPGEGCTVAEECQAPLVCGPAGTCVTEVPCTNNQGCGAGAICQNGQCVQNTPGGACTEPDDCVFGESCIAGTCVEGCGGDQYGAESVPPNLLIVFDRSGSMNERAGNDTKWNIARNATYNLLTTYQGQIRFGLNLFPGSDLACDEGDRCGPGMLSVELMPAAEEAIREALEDSGTCNLGTPIAEALGPLVDYAPLEDTSRANYILLLTDGMANCDDPVPAVTALREQDPEVKIFVVGFGRGVDPRQLRDMARAGGTARMGTPEYYQADDAASLRAAFASIAGAVLSCEYRLSSVPPDPDQLYVYFDGAPVTRDQGRNNGWDHQAGTNVLNFYGSACDQLQSGAVGQLQIVYGCPLPPQPDGGVTDTGPRDGNLDPGGNPCSSCSECGNLGCLSSGPNEGTCGPCTDDFECCLGKICSGGICVPNL